MSTGQACLLVEAEPGKWYYVLEGWDSLQFGDWLDSASAYGPFPSIDAASEHLSENHANPGGWWEQSFDPERPLSEKLAALIVKAPENMRALRGRWW